MKSALFYAASLLATVCTANPVRPIHHHPVKNAPNDLPRLIVYFQTTHDGNGNPISMLPLINEKGIALTHIIVCSLHVNAGGQIHLNDYAPSDPHFYTLFNETVSMKNAGVKVMGMVGGAAAGSFTTSTLDGDQATFDQYYGQLRDVIRQQGLQGMDLDVEQSMSQAGIARLVNALHNDFGPDFIITLAPVASALYGGGNLSGFDYRTLESDVGDKIDFYNSQFYSGFGSMASPDDYQNTVNYGYNPSRVVAGQLTSYNNGYGYIPTDQLNNTIITLRNEYGTLGGVFGWEYFNSLPGDTSQPWQWAQIVTEILRPDQVPNLRITHADAVRLTAAYKTSAAAHKGPAAQNKAYRPPVDYFAMVNA